VNEKAEVQELKEEEGDHQVVIRAIQHEGKGIIG